MWRPGRDVFFVLALLLWTLLPGCLEPAYLPVLAIPAATGLLVQQHDKKDPPASVAATTATTAPAPTSLPVECPPPLGNARQVTCADFPCRDRAQAFFQALLDAGLGDCHNLDDDGNGRVCIILPQCRPGQ